MLHPRQKRKLEQSKLDLDNPLIYLDNPDAEKLQAYFVAHKELIELHRKQIDLMNELKLALVFKAFPEKHAAILELSTGDVFALNKEEHRHFHYGAAVCDLSGYLIRVNSKKAASDD